MWHCNIAKSELSCIDLGQSNVTPRQVQHQIIAAYRYPYSRLKSGTGEASSDSCRDRVDMRSIDQDEPVARARTEGSSVIGLESVGSLSIRCIEMTPSSRSGSSFSPSVARNFCSAPLAGRRRTMPSAAPRPCPRLIVMRATARIMFLKPAMVFFDQSVGLASLAR